VALPRGAGCVLASLGPALASRTPANVTDNSRSFLSGLVRSFELAIERLPSLARERGALLGVGVVGPP